MAGKGCTVNSTKLRACTHRDKVFAVHEGVGGVRSLGISWGVGDGQTRFTRTAYRARPGLPMFGQSCTYYLRIRADKFACRDEEWGSKTMELVASALLLLLHVLQIENTYRRGNVTDPGGAAAPMLCIDIGRCGRQYPALDIILVSQRTSGRIRRNHNLLLWMYVFHGSFPPWWIYSVVGEIEARTTKMLKGKAGAPGYSCPEEVPCSFLLSMARPALHRQAARRSLLLDRPRAPPRESLHGFWFSLQAAWR